MIKNLRFGSSVVLALWMTCPAGSLAAEATDEDQVLVIKKVFTGKQTKFQDYLIQDAAATVSAADLAGVAPGVVHVMENTRDFTMYVKALSGGTSGGGIAITPARIKNPFPAITVEQYKSQVWARILAATTFSYAQGNTDVNGKTYKRRAFAVETNWYPYAEPSDPKQPSDDPIYEAIVTGESCLQSYAKTNGDATTKAAKSLNHDGNEAAAIGGGAPRPVPGNDTSKPGPDGRPLVLVHPDFEAYAKDVAPQISACSDRRRKAVAARWYRPVVSLSLASGDVGGGNSSSGNVTLGRHINISGRYGAAWTRDDEKNADTESIFGWAIYVSHNVANNAPILTTLGTTAVERESTQTSAARLSIGQSTWRALVEASDVKARQAAVGEQTLRKAIGLEYRLGGSAWLHLRYGRRLKDAGAGEEATGMLSLTLGAEALPF